jgi:hypothetical protein
VVWHAGSGWAAKAGIGVNDGTLYIGMDSGRVSLLVALFEVVLTFYLVPHLPDVSTIVIFSASVGAAASFMSLLLILTLVIAFFRLPFLHREHIVYRGLFYLLRRIGLFEQQTVVPPPVLRMDKPITSI